MMDAVLTHWLDEPGAVGGTAALLFAVVAFMKGWILPKWSQDQMIDMYEKAIAAAKTECDYHKAAHERLLTQFERSLNVADAAATVALRKGKT
jgi:hypothetical protein